MVDELCLEVGVYFFEEGWDKVFEFCVIQMDYVWFIEGWCECNCDWFEWSQQFC